MMVLFLFNALLLSDSVWLCIHVAFVAIPDKLKLIMWPPPTYSCTVALSSPYVVLSTCLCQTPPPPLHTNTRLHHLILPVSETQLSLMTTRSSFNLLVLVTTLSTQMTMQSRRVTMERALGMKKTVTLSITLALC